MSNVKMNMNPENGHKIRTASSHPFNRLHVSVAPPSMNELICTQFCKCNYDVRAEIRINVLREELEHVLVLGPVGVVAHSDIV